MTTQVRISRRAFLRLLGGLAVAGGASLAGYGTTTGLRKIEVVYQRLGLWRWQPGLEGLRVVQISDFHMGGHFGRDELMPVVEHVLALQPELIVCTGDYLTRGEDLDQSLRDLEEPLALLAEAAPFFSVMGNHDFYDGRAGRLQALLQRVGVQDATNRILTYDRGGDRLYIAGIGTLLTGDFELDRITYESPRDAPVILLAHEPDIAQWSHEKGRFVLQLSGHSHGGQMRLPLLGPLILPPLGRKYPQGLHRFPSMLLYTNRGIGTTRVAFRLNCAPEISVFTLEHERSSGS